MSNYWDAWSNKDAIEYYKNNRFKKADIYKSEDYFLSKILKEGFSVLDVGCAVGGFSEILKKYKEDIIYSGIDISDEMIKQARWKYPRHIFKVADGEKIPFPKEKFDLVICLGLMHLNLNWRKILKESWRVTKKYLLFDLRLLDKGKSIENLDLSYQKIEFESNWDGKSKLPYVLVNIADVLNEFSDLDPDAKNISIFGYFHKTTHMAQTPVNEICMATFCISKIGRANRVKIDWNLPIKMPKFIPRY